MNKITLMPMLVIMLNSACAERFQRELDSSASQTPACPTITEEDSQHIAGLLDHFKRVTSLEEGAGLNETLVISYEKNSCHFIQQAKSSGLDSRQISRILVSLPSETIDHPCRRRDILDKRWRLMESRSRSRAEEISEIVEIFKVSLEREVEACARER